MKDIDFDELDKAVNSLMSSSDAPSHHKKTVSSTHKKPTDTRPFPGNRRSVMPKAATVSPAKSPISASSLHPAPTSKSVAPAARRSGRFMDVVDSSSELNPIRQPITPPQKDISRKMVSSPTTVVAPVAPKSAVIESVPTLSMPTIVVPARTPFVPAPAGESVQVRRVEKDSTMPDPLELLKDTSILNDDLIITEDPTDDIRPSAAFGASKLEIVSNTDSVPVTVMSQQASLTSEPIIAPEIPQEDTTVEPVEPQEIDQPAVVVQEDESPFLQDAKIEKRPLNANPVTMNVIEPLVSIDELLQQDQPLEQDQAEEQVSTIAAEEQPPVSDVPELSSELVAIEATGKINKEDEEDGLVPVPMKSSTDGSQQISEPSVGPASITQQYKSKESTGDTSHAPIYDASQYADPVAHPAKKKSGWLWVLSVFILLALGSGGAVALYLTGIIP